MPSKREQLLEIMEGAAKGETKATLRARIAELEAEIERTKKWYLDAIEQRDKYARLWDEVLSRTGGVKVKALEWEEVHQRRSDADPTTEVVGYEAGIPGLWWYIDVGAADFSLTFPDYSYRTVATLEDAKAAAQADFERRILPALEPAATEGQQPVAWMDATGTELHKIIQDYQKRNMIAAGGRQAERAPNYSIALFTRPAEQAVTEAMVEAVVQAVRPYTMRTLFIDEHRELVRTALKAATDVVKGSGNDG